MKYNLIVVIFLASFQVIFGQKPETVWSKDIGEVYLNDYFLDRVWKEDTLLNIIRYQSNQKDKRCCPKEINLMINQVNAEGKITQSVNLGKSNYNLLLKLWEGKGFAGITTTNSKKFWEKIYINKKLETESTKYKRNTDKNNNVLLFEDAVSISFSSKYDMNAEYGYSPVIATKYKDKKKVWEKELRQLSTREENTIIEFKNFYKVNNGGFMLEGEKAIKNETGTTITNYVLINYDSEGNKNWEYISKEADRIISPPTIINDYVYLFTKNSYKKHYKLIEIDKKRGFLKETEISKYTDEITGRIFSTQIIERYNEIFIIGAISGFRHIEDKIAIFNISIETFPKLLMSKSIKLDKPGYHLGNNGTPQFNESELIIKITGDNSILILSNLYVLVQAETGIIVDETNSAELKGEIDSQKEGSVLIEIDENFMKKWELYYGKSLTSKYLENQENNIYIIFEEEKANDIDLKIIKLKK